MAESRLTQALIEAALLANNNARLTQQALEIIKHPTNDARMTQLALEIVLHHEPPPPLVGVCPVVSSGTVGVPYSSFVTAMGGTPPYTFTLTGGSLPPGLTLNSSTGQISGTPTQAGSFTYTITISDSASPVVSTSPQCTMIIAAAPPPPQGCPQFELRRVYAMMRPHQRIPVRGS